MNAISRRESLAGLAVVSAAAILPASAALAHLPTVERAKWDRAYAAYVAACEAVEASNQTVYLAEEAAAKDCPRVDRFFDEYRLGMGMSRERAVPLIVGGLCAKEFGECHGLALSPARDPDESRRKLESIRAKAEQEADAFMAYQERANAAKARYKLDHIHDENERVYDEIYFPARDRLMEIAAPDAAALLVKMELAEQSDCAAHHRAAYADAKRLLAA